MKSGSRKSASTVAQWVDLRQAQGRYTFLRADVLAETGLSVESVKKGLQRLARRGRIAKVKDYFYVIVPLEYLSAGGPPASWWIDDLMAAMKLPYYVGLLSAAAVHGASHQQPQEFQVVIDRSVRPVTAGRARVRFFASKFVVRAAAQNVKTPTGGMRVSTPETTVVDLVRFAKAAGGLDNVTTVISQLSSSLDAKKLPAAMRLVGDVPSAQRLGYIFDRLQARKLAHAVQNWIERQSPRPVPLRTGAALEGPEDRRWHVIVDHPLEADA